MYLLLAMRAVIISDILPGHDRLLAHETDLADHYDGPAYTQHNLQPAPSDVRPDHRHELCNYSGGYSLFSYLSKFKSQ